MSQCTPEEQWQAENNPLAYLRCLTRGQVIAASLRVETGFISLIAVLIVYGLIVRNVLRYREAAPGGSWRLLKGPADIYLLALFAFDSLQSIGRTLEIRWVSEGKVYAGTYCDATGAIQQVGETGSAQITLAIAVHTFSAVWYRKGKNARVVAAFVVVAVCIYSTLFVGIGIAKNDGTNHPYDAPAPYWCWIRPNSSMLALWLTGEYLWLWITLTISFLLYVPMYFLTRGNITIDETSWWRFSVHARGAHYVQTSVGMLAYPGVYALTILPLTVGRWYGFVHTEPSAVLFTVSCLYGLTGLFNVLLLLARPHALLFGAPDPDPLPYHSRLSSAAPPTERPQGEKPARQRSKAARGLPAAESDSDIEEAALPSVPHATAPPLRTVTHERANATHPYSQARGA